MYYLDLYQELKQLWSADTDQFEFDGLTVSKYNFKSASQHLLPGAENYTCQKHGKHFTPDSIYLNDIGAMNDHIYLRDVEIKENESFSYRVFMPNGEKRVNRALFLFHGFNEKNWDKYLPWAYHLAKQTGRAVILFPIAFHMNRTLSLWSDKRNMFLLSEKRKKMFPNVVNSSLSNVAISMRLHAMPQRFIWSGLQTYYDVIQFITACKNDEHPLLASDTTFDLMSYSIGCLLSEVLKLSNYNGYFSQSKLCMFCGGAVFNRLSPVSKYILDSEANIALYSYMVEHLEKHLEKDAHLKHYLAGDHKEGQIFYSMLDYKVQREYREQLFREVSSDLMAISLKQDSIIPAYEIVNTLQGAARDISVPVHVHDFSFKYNHVTPFPATEKNKELIDESFRMVFNQAAEFLMSE